MFTSFLHVFMSVLRCSEPSQVLLDILKYPLMSTGDGRPRQVLKASSESCCKSSGGHKMMSNDHVRCSHVPVTHKSSGDCSTDR